MVLISRLASVASSLLANDHFCPTTASQTRFANVSALCRPMACIRPRQACTLHRSEARSLGVHHYSLFLSPASSPFRTSNMTWRIGSKSSARPSPSQADVASAKYKDGCSLQKSAFSGLQEDDLSTSASTGTKKLVLLSQEIN